ncbi:hypothetical protein CJF32_00002481 [Rutstroemia sp. NJR-2017a WRK4]|nr:hypothetical protein CJF32_00002481 [Rutstroemia sp. NJR-2017a WRK4]
MVRLRGPSSVCLAIQFLSTLDIVVAHYPIGGVHTGVNAQSGARPARRDILEFQNDTPSWSLYIQAMTAFQKVPETDPLSYFQIAGIHGRPYIPWDSVPHNRLAPNIGYCTHSDVLFPTWHRPYLALFEQVLAQHVQTIAATYNSDVYTQAANNFRIPYWDWAAIPALPPVVSDNTVQIETPTGTQTVANPLLLYKFQQFPLNPTWFPNGFNVGKADRDLSQDPVTLRCPDKAVQGTSQPSTVNQNLGAGGLMNMVYSVFTKSKQYYNMATQISPGPSFESPHGSVHVAIGGQYGHMSQLSYSAFDPIFWLHHANVDRLFAMWQAIYPNVYLQPALEQVGTFTISQGAIDTSSSPLTPFSTSDGNTAWTSDSARTTRTFGYSYSSVPDAIITNATELAANVTATVNALYNPKGVFTSSKVKRDQQREWSVTIQALSTALDGRYLVKVLERGNPIGSLHVLQPPAADGGSKPALTFHNEFSLQQVVRDVDHSDQEAMVAYLKENLSWEVQKVCSTLLILDSVNSALFRKDGTVIPNENVLGLIVTVQDEIVIHPADETQFPVYGTKTLHPEITSGKAGGLSSS